MIKLFLENSRTWRSYKLYTLKTITTQISLQVHYNGLHCGIITESDSLFKYPYSVKIQENTDQKKLRIRTLFTQCKIQVSSFCTTNFAATLTQTLKYLINPINQGETISQGYEWSVKIMTTYHQKWELKIT